MYIRWHGGAERQMGAPKGKWGLMTNDIRSKVIACEQLGGAKGKMGCQNLGAPKCKWGAERRMGRQKANGD
jgi:hypothetical protein